ncbi:MAG: ribonuclease HI family protein [Methanotrichaceae archaeon]|nr:ribonuclease HI family protein [Methanotrichaceae archaeon]
MITIYFDGLCYPVNPGGVAAYGYLAKRNGEPIHEGWGAVGEGRGMTNNVAEYEGLLAAMRWVKKKGLEEKIVIKGDSQLVIKQMRGEWQVKSATSQRYVPEIKKLCRGLEVSFQWVRREENQEADELSRRAYREYRDLQNRSRASTAKKE